MSQVPFTVWFEVTPNRGQQRNPNRQPANSIVRGRKGGRSDYIRSLQRISSNVYDALDEVSSLNLPAGSGQNRSFGYFSNVIYGTGIALQFGESPNRFMIEGFANIDIILSDYPNPNVVVFHGNEVLQGQLGQQPWLGPAGNPTTDVEDEVVALKNTIESAIISVLDGSGVPPRIFRMLYKNITWGDRGHHFPR